MLKTPIIRCPNCGAIATKETTGDDIQRVSCRQCDYLLVQCTEIGRVFKAYAPGIKSDRAGNSVFA